MTPTGQADWIHDGTTLFASLPDDAGDIVDMFVIHSLLVLVFTSEKKHFLVPHFTKGLPRRVYYLPHLQPPTWQ